MHSIDRVATPTGTDAHAFDELPPAGIRELPLKYKIGAPLQDSLVRFPPSPLSRGVGDQIKLEELFEAFFCIIYLRIN